MQTRFICLAKAPLPARSRAFICLVKALPERSASHTGRATARTPPRNFVLRVLRYYERSLSWRGRLSGSGGASDTDRATARTPSRNLLLRLLRHVPVLAGAPLTQRWGHRSRGDRRPFCNDDHVTKQQEQQRRQRRRRR